MAGADRSVQRGRGLGPAGLHQGDQFAAQRFPEQGGSIRTVVEIRGERGAQGHEGGKGGLGIPRPVEGEHAEGEACVLRRCVGGVGCRVEMPLDSRAEPVGFIEITAIDKAGEGLEQKMAGEGIGVAEAAGGFDGAGDVAAFGEAELAGNGGCAARFGRLDARRARRVWMACPLRRIRRRR